jgi:hypothetical protein
MNETSKVLPLTVVCIPEILSGEFPVNKSNQPLKMAGIYLSLRHAKNFQDLRYKSGY